MFFFYEFVTFISDQSGGARGEVREGHVAANEGWSGGGFDGAFGYFFLLF